MSRQISDGIKAEFMKEWCGRSSAIIIGDGFDRNGLEKVVLGAETFLRNGIDEMMQFCQMAEVPFYIVSAGLGNVIDVFISTLENRPLIKVFSNFLAEDEEGKLTVLTGPAIVSIEKHLVLAGKQLRSHFILLGDLPSVRYI